MAIFFDSKNNGSAYLKLIQHNEHVMRSTRITHAKELLQQLHQEIEHRVEKKQQFINFLTTQRILYEQLTQEYQTTPTAALAQRLSKLRQAIINSEIKLQNSTAKQLITDLRKKQAQLKALIEEQSVP